MKFLFVLKIEKLLRKISLIFWHLPRFFVILHHVSKPTLPNACRMGTTKRHTADVAPQRYGLGTAAEEDSEDLRRNGRRDSET